MPADTAETQSQADGWYTCDQCLAVAQRPHRQEMLLGIPINYASQCLQSRPTSHCIILHETFGGATRTKTSGGILKYGYSIYSFQVTMPTKS